MRKVLVLAFVAFFSLIYTDVWGTVTYSVTGTGSNLTLTISGSGAMTNYTSGGAPWYSNRLKIKTIVIEDGVTSIGNYAFEEITYSTITIPTSVTSFGIRAFQSISSGSARKVYYKGTPNNWAGIDFKMADGASYPSSHPFYNNSSANNHIYFYDQTSTETTNIVFTPGLTTIQPYVFWYAGNITNVNIPNSVTSIGKQAFWHCSSLCRVFVNNTTAPTASSDAFQNITSGASASWLYLPYGANSGTGVGGFKKLPWYDSSYSGKGPARIGYQGTDVSGVSAESSFGLSNSKVYPRTGTVDGITWTLDDDGVMTFSGSGAITTTFTGSSGDATYSPWMRWRYLVDKVVITGGITGLSNALDRFDALREVEINQTIIPTSGPIGGTSTTFASLINTNTTDKITLRITDPTSRSDDSWSNLSSAPWNHSRWEYVFPTACSDWSLHYGTDGEADWNEECFTYTGSSNEWQIEDFVIPDKPNWYVDNATGDDAKKTLSDWGDLYFAASQGDGDRPMVGDATGAIGTVRIYDNSTWNNRYAGFIPNGYVLKIGSTEYPFTFESGNEYRTEIFEYNSTNARDNVSVGIADADGDFVGTANTSEMQHLFLKVSSDWASSSAKFSIYDIDAGAFKYGFMTLIPGTTDLYEGWVDGTCGNVIFVRHNSTATSPSFDSGNKWNQTGDLALQSGKNYFTINQGTWDGQTEGWSAYTRRGRYCIWQNSIEKNWGVCFRPCHEFNATQDANWNNANNWSPNSLPTINHDVIINKPAVVNTTSAVAKSVIINQADDNTGKIEIAAGQKLIVANTIRKTTDGESLSATDADDITIHSDGTNGLGALVMGTHDGTNKATVNFYTKSNGEDGNNTSVGQYVGTPFNDENNILYNWYNSWVYGITYSGAGAIDWYRVNEGEGMNPFKGYCVFSADGTGHSYWQQGTLVASVNQNLSGLNWQSGSGTANANNENLLANSWVAPIKINAMESSDFTNADATVYIFNSTSNSAYVDLGNYATYPVNSAADAAIIPSMQSFSVFTTGSGASVSLDYSKIVYDPAVGGTVPGPNKAPRLTKAETAHRMKLYVSAENGYSDMLYLLEHLDFEEGFENGWDGHKLFGESVAPQLYAVTPDGNMAVNCVPTYEGVVLGFKAGEQDQNYTFRFEYDDESQPLYLLDISTNTCTQVMSENHYTFITSDNEAHNRFVLTYKAPSVTTSIDNTTSPSSNTGQKVIYNNHLYIIRNGRVFSAQGMMVK